MYISTTGSSEITILCCCFVSIRNNINKYKRESTVLVPLVTSTKLIVNITMCKCIVVINISMILFCI